jgi:hypothetical protein
MNLCTTSPSVNSTIFTSGISYLSVNVGLVVELALLLATFVCFSLAEIISFRTLKWMPIVVMPENKYLLLGCHCSFILLEACAPVHRCGRMLYFTHFGCFLHI